MEAARLLGVATGYSMVLPPGWRRIPLRVGTNEAISRIVDEVVDRVSAARPQDSLVPHRIELDRRLSLLATQAREESGLDLYLPVEQVHGVAVPASIAVSEGSPGPAGSAPGDPGQVVAFLVAEQDDATQVVLDGAIGVRTERSIEGDPLGKAPIGLRRVNYALAVPGRPDQWLIFVFTVLRSGDRDGRYATILVELFDAMMSTFRWAWE